MKLGKFWERISGLDLISGAWCRLCWDDLPDHSKDEVKTVFLEARRADVASSVGEWTSVAESMPDDEISVLVWSEHLEDACLCYHDSEVKARRGDSGWIMTGTRRVVLGVTHWCGDVRDPNTKSCHE